jgi:beta-mannosidase
MPSGEQLLEVSEFFVPGASPAGAWSLVSLAAGQVSAPEQLLGLQVRPALVPGTVAAEFRRTGQLSRDPAPRLDEEDHWYRTSIRADEWPVASVTGARRLLVFDGLATLASVWINGKHVLDAANMYRRYAIDVTEQLQPENELVLRFAALTPVLKTKKGPRRWLTRLVTERNLRAIRTTLLGRMPGWTPPWPVVGPYRPVRLVTTGACVLNELRCVPSVDAAGRCEVRVDLGFSTIPSGAHEGEPQAHLEISGKQHPLPISAAGADGYRVNASIPLGDLTLWWPHTHGEPALHSARVAIQIGDRCEHFTLPPLGFRALELLPQAHFGFKINGIEIFCRGACWTPLDVVSLGASEAGLRAALLQVKAAGMNMLRLSGTLLYEESVFHQLCDELGLLVWQDFMFANMDYPRDDPQFDAEVTAEVSQLTERLAAHCSTVLLCGGSETEQQAAMMGIPSDQWRHGLWREQLPRLVAAFCPELPYFYASPGGAGMPFWPQDGCTHYYGVGAYMRAETDARLSGVRFASECLAFANPPDIGGAFVGTPGRPLGRVPQDNGASWDFGDVTEHYLQRFFAVDPGELRSLDPERYLELARQAIARAMRSTQSHFRDPNTECRGSLIWLLRDLEPGSGWGIIDAEGRPKSGYHALARMWAPRAAWFVDEGLSGLTVVVANDPGTVLDCHLTVIAEAADARSSETFATSLSVPAHGYARIRVEELAGRFLDSSYAYRFGPPAHRAFRLRLTVGEVLLAEDAFDVTAPR